MNRIIQKRMAARKRRLARRLDKFNYPDDLARPMLRATNIEYELAGRSVGTACGGIGLVHQLVRELGFAGAIDHRVHLFKIHLPYHECDHVFSLAYNALCGGRAWKTWNSGGRTRPISTHWEPRGFPTRPRREIFADDSPGLQICRGRSTSPGCTSGHVSRQSSLPRHASTPTARWSRPGPSANRGSIFRTRASGDIIRWC